jgi:hypothetical protein
MEADIGRIEHKPILGERFGPVKPGFWGFSAPGASPRP